MNSFLSIFKQRISDHFRQLWHDELHNSSRALFYRSISQFRFQYYLEIVTVNKFRTALAKLRLSSHRLEGETGRWARPIAIPFSERVCNVCNKLEDEFHFVLECPIYLDIRKLYINNYYFKKLNMYKMVEHFNTTNKKQLRNLSVYIYKAFEIRRNVMFVRDVS